MPNLNNCTFIGYGQYVFGYNSIERKLIRSHDVLFVEDQTMEDNFPQVEN